MARRNNALAVAAPMVKTIIFAAVSVLIIGLLWIQFGQIRFTSQRDYAAVFANSSGLQPASSVTADGVQVGRVDSVRLGARARVTVAFTIDSSVTLTTNTHATIRWSDLTGDQYLDLTSGPAGGRPLAAGSTIPVSHTSPALDLDVLLNGFNPLLQGLQPDEVNQLSGELVSVLQGQGGTIDSVLAHAASFSGSLAGQDKVIGQVIDNFGTVLGSLDAHSAQLSDTVVQAQRLVSALNAHRAELVSGMARTSRLADQVGDVAAALRSGHDTLTQLGRAAGVLDDQPGEFNRILRLLPSAYLRLGRVSTSGASFDLNVCAVRLRLTGPDGNPFYTPQIGPSDNNLRCSADDVAPLRGEGPTSPLGPQSPMAPFDGQAVAKPAQRQADGTSGNGG